jgi:glycine cleavage system H protein
VVAVNGQLVDSPGRLNDDPYGEGWICLIEPPDPSVIDSLLEPEAYRRLITE